MNRRIFSLALVSFVLYVVSVETVEAQVSRSSTGVVMADRSVTLAAKIVGRIAAVNVEEGQSVEAGDVLINWVYAESCGLILAFLGSGGRNAATIFSLRYSSSR